MKQLAVVMKVGLILCFVVSESYSQNGPFVSTHKSMYRHMVEEIVFSIRNAGSAAVVLPNDSPWSIKRSSGETVAYGSPRGQGTVPIQPARSMTWRWNQTSLDGSTPVEPGDYSVEVQTNSHGIISDHFEIRNARDGLKAAARVGEAGAASLGAAASWTALQGQPWLVAAEAGLWAIGWALDRYAEDPPQEDYSRRVERRTINPQLPSPGTALERSVRDFASSCAHVVEALVPLTDSIELFELAELAGVAGGEAKDMHRREIGEFSELLVISLGPCIESLDALVTNIKFSGLPLSMSGFDAFRFQDQVLQDGLPRVGQFDERSLLQQYLLTDADIAELIRQIASRQFKDGIDVLAEYAALRRTFGEMIVLAKDLPEEFSTR